MTPEQIKRIQTTWDQIITVAPQAGEVFYHRLFELDPDLKTLFKSDTHEMNVKLMRTLNLVVSRLDDPESFLSLAHDLGYRHVGYGVQDAHYETVGAALLWTLKTVLGELFQTDSAEAWTTAYGALANEMKMGAAEATATGRANAA